MSSTHPHSSSAPPNLKDQVALVTGASRGIGEAIARQLASLGFHLALTARTTHALDILAKDLRTQYPDIQVHTHATNVQDPPALKQLVETVHQEFKQIDLLINNAGVGGKVALLQEVSEEDISTTIDVNLKAPLYLMKYVLPLMVSQQRGTIININSVAGKTPFPYWSVYDASKFGLHAATMAVAEEQRSNSIRVVGIYPGAVNTTIWDTLDLEQNPNREGMLHPEDIARAVEYIVNQPPQIYIPEITLTPLQPAL